MEERISEKIFDALAMFFETIVIVVLIGFLIPSTEEKFFGISEYIGNSFFEISLVLGVIGGLLFLFLRRKSRIRLLSGVLGLFVGVFLLSAAFVDYEGPGVDARRRDVQRVTQIKLLQAELDLYYDEHGTYPANLFELKSFSPDIVISDISGSSFFYTFYEETSNEGEKNREGYHLGTNLETIGHSALLNDADCNSVSGEGCILGDVYDKEHSFTGSDEKGCSGERKRACFDVTE